MLKYTILTVVLSVALNLVVLTNTAQASPVAVLDDGELIGFDDISVGSTDYKVRFIYGSYNSIFVDPSGLDFTTAADAGDAADALLAAFNLFPTYDDNPDLTVNISSTITGRIWTPFRAKDTGHPNDTATSKVYKNTSGTNLNPDAIEQSAVIRTASKLYADWEAVVVVPVPASIWLSGSAVLGVVATRAKR